MKYVLIIAWKLIQNVFNPDLVNEVSYFTQQKLKPTNPDFTLLHRLILYYYSLYSYVKYTVQSRSTFIQ
jgi:hypothetical protein